MGEKERKLLRIKKKHLYVMGIVSLLLIILFSYTTVKNNVSSTELTEKSVREPVVAGYWYPAKEKELQAMVSGFYDRAKDAEIDGKVMALIEPHAGFVYSGQIAAYGFKQLRDKYKTVIVLGPSHRYPLVEASILNVTHYKTPLGEIRLSSKVKELLKEDIIDTVPEAHAQEHSIESELPFLQEKLGDFELIPILVGQIDFKELANVLIKYTDENTLLVVSADLSHYHPYDEAVKLDTFCLNVIDKMDANRLNDCEIDARWAVAALFEIAKEKGWESKVIAYANSGDVTGDKSKGVVGYSAVAFYEEKGVKKEEQDFLLKLARETLEGYIKEGKVPEVNEDLVSEELMEKQGCFVTLEKNHQLRGCIGHIIPQKPLYQCVIENTVNAAVNDKRFMPVTEDELEDIEVEISVLTVPQELSYSSSDELLGLLRPGIDGIIILSGMYQSTYLPQVWLNFNNEKESFLSSLCQKGGAARDCWKDMKTKVFTYQAQVFDEE
jgi:hypothetical protein